MGPCGNVAKAIFRGFNAKILAHGVGNAFRLHFFCVPVLFFRNKKSFPIVCGLCHVFVIMELGMSDFVDSGANGLYLAHALPQENCLLLGGKIAVHIRFHFLKGNGHRGSAPQRFQKYFILRDIPGESGADLWQRLSVCLGHIEHRYNLEHGNGDFLFLGDGFPVFVQQRQSGVRVQFLLLLLDFIGGGGQYLNPFFTLFDMTAKAVLPLVEACHQRGIRALGVDQHHIVQGVSVKPAHGCQVVPVTVRFKEFQNAFFNPGSYFLDTFFVRLLFSHKMLLSLFFRGESPQWKMCTSVGIPAFRNLNFGFPISFAVLLQSAGEKLWIFADFLPLKCGT